jgi:hypothetical protein
MIFALPVLAAAGFAAVVFYRLRLDAEQERSFRAQLRGVTLEANQIRLH